MSAFKFLSAAEQLAAHWRWELGRGIWSGMMPGVHQLAVELGVGRKTVEAALRQLEREGLLAGQGPGRNRRILPPKKNVQPPLRVGILLFERTDRHLEYVIELHHALLEAGHAAIFPAKSLTELNMEVARIRRLVEQTPADAWVVMAATRAVLEWFSVQPVPAFALFGRHAGLPIAAAGPKKSPAFAAATRHLIRLGHRRIVLLARRLRRRPQPGQSEQAFLDELQAHGVATGDFNLPDWEETPEGFQHRLSELFRVTPPTALMVEEVPLFIATQQFLARRRLRVPEEVSLICTDPDPTFAWCRPSIAHIHWDPRPFVRRILRWAAAVSRGRRDERQTFFSANFVAGGTVGPTPTE